MSHTLIRMLLLSALLGAWSPASAHKLQVFAYADGERIEGSTYFAGGAPASGASIHVLDSGGRELAELAPDSQGRFSYVAQSPIEHIVSAETADGHRAEWRIGAAELGGGFASQESAPIEVSSAVGADAPGQSEGSPSSSEVCDRGGAGLDPQLEAAIERAVARQIHPLREELVRAQGHARLQDILGGLGYILGATGLGLWWTGRRQSTLALKARK